MPIEIDDPAALAEIDEFAKLLGVEPEEAVEIAVREAWQSLQFRRTAEEARLTADIEALQERVAALPILDPRPWREIASDLAGDAQIGTTEGDRAA